MRDRRLLVATDFGPAAEAALRLAARIAAGDPAAEVVLLHALAGGADDAGYARAEEACLALTRQVEEAGGAASSTLVLRLEPPGALIPNSARELRATLVLIGRRAGEASPGAVARAALRSSPAPLAIVGDGWREPRRVALPPASRDDAAAWGAWLGRALGIPAEPAPDGAQGPGTLLLGDLRDSPPLARSLELETLLSSVPPDGAVLALLESAHAPPGLASSA
ncbi:MAG: universal stress protein [Planctomycetota bacterium]